MTAAFSGEALGRVAAVLRARCGLSFGEHNRFELERAVRQAGVHFPGAEDGRLHELLEDPARCAPALEWLIHEVTVGETYFFRTREQFAVLRDRAVPELLARKVGQRDRELRAWSAGCSTGEEAYSLAIALCEAAPGLEVSVLGTDLNRRALERATRAEYSAWSLRGVDEAERARYFEPASDTTVRVREPFRGRARFGHLNLTTGVYPDPLGGTEGLELIFCRNVFIYLEAPAVAECVARMASCLCEGGYLFCGPSDPLPRSIAGLEVVRCDGSHVFRKVSASRAPRPSPRVPLAAPRARPAPRWPAPAPQVPATEAPPGPLLDRARCRREAQAHVERGELEAAARWAARWLELEPESALACHLLSVLPARPGDRTTAFDYARRAACLDPELVLAHFTMAELHSANGRSAEAAACLRRTRALLENKPDDEVLAGSEEITAGWLRRVIDARLTPTLERA